MRVKEVEFAGKKITIRELKIKELDSLIQKIGVDFDQIFSAKSVGDVKNSLLSILEDKLPVMFPEIKKADIKEAYPSEIETVIEGFVDTNFFGLRKVVMPLMSLGLKR